NALYASALSKFNRIFKQPGLVQVTVVRLPGEIRYRGQWSYRRHAKKETIRSNPHQSRLPLRLRAVPDRSQIRRRPGQPTASTFPSPVEPPGRDTGLNFSI